MAQQGELGCGCSGRVFAPRRILGPRLNLPNKVGGVWFGLTVHECGWWCF